MILLPEPSAGLTLFSFKDYLYILSRYQVFYCSYGPHIREHTIGGHSLDWSVGLSRRQHTTEHGQMTLKHRNTQSVHTVSARQPLKIGRESLIRMRVVGMFITKTFNPI